MGVLKDKESLQKHNILSTFQNLPHTARKRRPVVFIHGIGVGLWPYTPFLNEIGRSRSGSTEEEEEHGQIGVLVLEILPITTRLTDPPLRKDEFVKELRTILEVNAPEWLDNGGFVLVSHSYGSVLTTHAIRDPGLAPHVRGVVLIDPVTLLLHLPNVAYNFTRRPPRTANEWQLWFFASMDVSVAEGLGRHFWWRDNEVWKEELVGRSLAAEEEGVGPVARSRAQSPAREGTYGTFETPQASRRTARKVAVCLSGRDLIVETRTVARYLARPGDMADSESSPEQEAVDALFESREAGTKSSGKSPRCTRYRAPSGVDILWFPTLDHAQVFDAREVRQRVLDVIQEYCSTETAV